MMRAGFVEMCLKGSILIDAIKGRVSGQVGRDVGSNIRCRHFYLMKRHYIVKTVVDIE